MRELEGLIALGKGMRTTSATRGALIQLEGDTAYMVNEPRSIALRLKFDDQELGDGTFYAGEAVPGAHRVQRRGDKVLFEWRERGKVRRKMVPDRAPIDEKVEDALRRYGAHPDDHVRVPTSVLDDLNRNILTTRISVRNNKVVTRQLRSDASEEHEVETELRRGLIAVEHPDTPETTVFTADLYVMRGLVDELQVAFGDGGRPLSIRGRFNFGAEFEGVIAHMVYEV